MLETPRFSSSFEDSLSKQLGCLPAGSHLNQSDAWGSSVGLNKNSESIGSPIPYRRDDIDYVVAKEPVSIEEAVTKMHTILSANGQSPKQESVGIVVDFEDTEGNNRLLIAKKGDVKLSPAFKNDVLQQITAEFDEAAQGTEIFIDVTPPLYEQQQEQKKNLSKRIGRACVAVCTSRVKGLAKYVKSHENENGEKRWSKKQRAAQMIGGGILAALYLGASYYSLTHLPHQSFDQQDSSPASVKKVSVQHKVTTESSVAVSHPMLKEPSIIPVQTEATIPNVPSVHQAPPDHVATASAQNTFSVVLTGGENPWNETRDYLVNTGISNPSELQILQKYEAEVPLNGGRNFREMSHNLPTGFSLKIPK